MKKACTISCCSWERVCMELEVSVGTGMENADAEPHWDWLCSQTARHSLYKDWGENAYLDNWWINHPHPQSWLLPLPVGNQIPSIPLLCLSTGSLTVPSAPCIEPTFREIVYQLHSADRLIPNPGTTLQLPWTVAQYTTEECTVWSPFSEEDTESQIDHMSWPRSHSECWVKERAYMLIPEPILFLTTRLDWSLALPADFP